MGHAMKSRESPQAIDLHASILRAPGPFSGRPSGAGGSRTPRGSPAADGCLNGAPGHRREAPSTPRRPGRPLRTRALPTGDGHPLDWSRPRAGRCRAWRGITRGLGALRTGSVSRRRGGRMHAATVPHLPARPSHRQKIPELSNYYGHPGRAPGCPMLFWRGIKHLRNVGGM
jgi:hypothetical protein